MDELNGRFVADKAMLEQQQMIEDCEKRESKLSEWEAGFIDLLSKRIGQGKSLSLKQSSILETIWNRVTN